MKVNKSGTWQIYYITKDDATYSERQRQNFQVNKTDDFVDLEFKMVTGGWQGAAVGTFVGAGIGLFAPGTSYTAASMATAALLGGASNIAGQAVGSAIVDRPCGQSYLEHFGENFNGWSVLGASVGSAFSPLFADVAAGSILAEGAMTGVATGYYELAVSTTADLY